MSVIVLRVKLIFPFAGDIEIVASNITKALLPPAGPGYLDQLSCGFRTQSEIRAQIALRQVATSAGNFADLRNSASYKVDARPHPVTITPGSN